MYKIDLIKEKIRENDIISFDIFDTLIKRDVVDPTEVFKLAYDRLNLNISNYTGEDFRRDRILAEKKARISSEKEEITLDDIYRKLSKLDGNLLIRLKQSEKQVEKMVCVKNPDLAYLFDYAKKQDKRIIITTDMYLDIYTIKDILAENGYRDYDNIYLSSSLRKTKASSCIYKIVIDDYKDNKILHIGDNKTSDYKNAKKMGISAVLIPINNTNLKHSKKDQLSHFISNRIHFKDSYYYSLGYEILGPLLYSYTKWIDSENKNSNLFFLARDGYLMKRAFDIISPNNHSKCILASRRGLIVPSLNKYKTISDFINHMYIAKYISVNDLLVKFGIPKDKLDKKNESLNKIYYNVKTLLSDKEAVRLIKKYSDKIINNSKYEEKLLTKYLYSQGFYGRVSIVDIGWFGNMQNALSKVTGDDVKISGYYMGCKKDSFYNHDDYKKGFLFGRNFGLKNEKSISLYTDVFEMMFTHLSGSFIRFNEENGNLKAEKKPLDYDKDVYSETIKKIQDGAIKFIQDFEESYASTFISIDRVEAFYRMNHFGLHPSKNDVRQIKLIQNKTGNNFVHSENFWTYLFNPKKFMIDFSKSWKAAFLLDVFKLKLPYLGLYFMLKSFVNVFKRK